MRSERSRSQLGRRYTYYVYYVLYMLYRLFPSSTISITSLTWRKVTTCFVLFVYYQTLRSNEIHNVWTYIYLYIIYTFCLFLHKSYSITDVVWNVCVFFCFRLIPSSYERLRYWYLWLFLTRVYFVTLMTYVGMRLENIWYTYSPLFGLLQLYYFSPQV